MATIYYKGRTYEGPSCGYCGQNFRSERYRFCPTCGHKSYAHRQVLAWKSRVFYRENSESLVGAVVVLTVLAVFGLLLIYVPAPRKGRLAFDIETKNIGERLPPDWKIFFVSARVASDHGSVLVRSDETLNSFLSTKVSPSRLEVQHISLIIDNLDWKDRNLATRQLMNFCIESQKVGGSLNNGQ